MPLLPIGSDTYSPPCAGLRVHLLANEVDEIGVALKFRMITAAPTVFLILPGGRFSLFEHGSIHWRRSDNT
jgi:hypothetical protein